MPTLVLRAAERLTMRECAWHVATGTLTSLCWTYVTLVTSRRHVMDTTRGVQDALLLLSSLVSQEGGFSHW